MLRRDQWSILGRRCRTEAGEIDIVAGRPGLVTFVEVKARRTAGEAAHAISVRQQTRLVGAAEILLADHPEWADGDVRFDLVLIDDHDHISHVQDAFRAGMIA